MINVNCLVMTPKLKELNSQFPKLPSKLFRDYVSRWQYEYGREGEIPTKDELIRLITKVSDNWADYINPDEVKVTNIYASANQNTILSNFANRSFFLTGLNEGTTMNRYYLTCYILFLSMNIWCSLLLNKHFR